jgi:site-specific recombinase XerD
VNRALGPTNASASVLTGDYTEILTIRSWMQYTIAIPHSQQRLSTVLTKEEVRKVVACLSGTHQLMAKVLYGSGLRLMECIRLHVKDVDFEQRQIAARDGKGMKDLFFQCWMFFGASQ